MTGRLDGQSILVVGGGSGIGKAVALAYHSEGAGVTVLERSPENATELGQIEGLQVIVGDATERSSLDCAVRAAIVGFGGLDNLTCCVGIFDHHKSFRDLDAAALSTGADEIWRVNVLSTFEAIHASLNPLDEAGGSITLTLSESAFHPVGGGVLYGSSKWALRGAVSHLARDLAPRVRVNAVAPGGTTGTNFSGLQSLELDQRSVASVAGRDERIAGGTLLGVTPTPADHAGAYVYLADPVAARIVTGIIINTDGGKNYG